MTTKHGKGAADQDTPEPVPVICSQRWILAYSGFFLLAIVYSLRVNISVAIVCMVKSANNTNGDSHNDTSCAAAFEAENKSSNSAEFDWSHSTRSTLLASFFYGYIVTQVPGGWLASRFGGKRVLGVTVTFASVITLLVPVAARYNVILLYAIRVLLGLSTGVSFPAFHAMWGRWAPRLEMSKLTTFCYQGATFGNIVTYPVAGLLCAYGFDNGWGSIYYLTGACGIICSAVWFYTTSDAPETHPRISDVEVKHITSTNFQLHEKRRRIPWLQMAKSKALYACLIAHMCEAWSWYTLLTGLPTFMNEVLKFDIRQNGALSAVPYICQVVSAIASGQVADYLRSREILSTTTVRKLFQLVSFAGTGACLVGTGFVSCHNRVIAVVLLSVAVMFMGMGNAGYLINHIDFAPTYAGVLLGITNTFATIPGMVAPIVAGALTPNNTQEEWRNVFYVCAAFLVLGMFVFGVFASGEIQDWAKEPDMDVDIEIEKKTDMEATQNHNSVENTSL